MIHTSKELQAAIDAAKLGGKIAQKYFESTVESIKKKDKSIVTIADIEVEQAIKASITKHFPDAVFVGEEEGGSDQTDEFWIIDPIDSTRNFSRGIPLWSINIALYKNKEIVLGVLYFPTSSDLLYAEQKHGAYLNDKKIHVSKITTLDDTIIGHQSLRRFSKNQQLVELAKHTATTRGYESNYSSALVAQGKIEAAMCSFGGMWDYAPLKVIIEEAGGKVTNLEGKPWELHDSGFLTSNGLIHDTIIEFLNK